jgi:hypothetical protein
MGWEGPDYGALRDIECGKCGWVSTWGHIVCVGCGRTIHYTNDENAMTHPDLGTSFCWPSIVWQPGDYKNEGVGETGLSCYDKISRRLDPRQSAGASTAIVPVTLPIVPVTLPVAPTATAPTEESLPQVPTSTVSTMLALVPVTPPTRPRPIAIPKIAIPQGIEGFQICTPGSTPMPSPRESEADSWTMREQEVLATPHGSPRQTEDTRLVDATPMPSPRGAEEYKITSEDDSDAAAPSLGRVSVSRGALLIGHFNPASTD